MLACRSRQIHRSGSAQIPAGNLIHPSAASLVCRGLPLSKHTINSYTMHPAQSCAANTLATSCSTRAILPFAVARNILSMCNCSNTIMTVHVAWYIIYAHYSMCMHSTEFCWQVLACWNRALVTRKASLYQMPTLDSELSPHCQIVWYAPE